MLQTHESLAPAIDVMWEVDGDTTPTPLSTMSTNSLNNGSRIRIIAWRNVEGDCLILKVVVGSRLDGGKKVDGVPSRRGSGDSTPDL